MLTEVGSLFITVPKSFVHLLLEVLRGLKVFRLSELCFFFVLSGETKVRNPEDLSAETMSK